MPNDLANTSWNETDGSNTSAPPNGWQPGMFPNQVEPTGQQMMGALKRWWGRINGVYTSTGASGVYAVTPANTGFPTAYANGERYCWKAHQNSVGGDSLNWNGVGATAIYKPTTGGLVAIAANDIVTGQRVDVMYDSTLLGFILMTPPTASVGAPVQSGVVQDYAGIALPAGYLWCNGAAVSRTTYATLFGLLSITQNGNVTSGSNVIPGLASTAALQVGWPLGGGGIPAGTTITSIDSATQIHISQNANSGSGTPVSLVFAPWGIGDGATTFNVPDLQGRAAAGLDGMGGASLTNRITSGTGGLTGAQLGAVGGNQALQQHSHGVSDPTHSHGVNDPSHRHGSNNGNGFITGGGGGVQIGGPVNGESQDANVTAYAGTGISLANAGTGISIASAGGGSSQNLQPTAIVNKIIKT